MAKKKDNSMLGIVLILGGAAVLVYLLTRKTAVPQGTVTVSPTVPISATQALEGSVTSQLPNLMMSLENYL